MDIYILRSIHGLKGNSKKKWDHDSHNDIKWMFIKDYIWLRVRKLVSVITSPPKSQKDTFADQKYWSEFTIVGKVVSNDGSRVTWTSNGQSRIYSTRIRDKNYLALLSVIYNLQSCKITLSE